MQQLLRSCSTGRQKLRGGSIWTQDRIQNLSFSQRQFLRCTLVTENQPSFKCCLWERNTEIFSLRLSLEFNSTIIPLKKKK